jgi:ppGpp synthetase/RelA/SpoT-type nucleotidyltranferase
MALSRSQLDRLGERLRAAEEVAPGNRRLFEEYRAGHAEALARVQARVAAATGYEPTGRLKTLESTVAKLRRQPIRLSRMSDIAGCRITVLDLGTQDDAVAALRGAFGEPRVKDYRESPHAGYRAVHLLVTSSDRLDVEVQVRTELQDAWANLSERVARSVDPSLKYGGGPEVLQGWLERLSEEARSLDTARARLRAGTGEVEVAEAPESLVEAKEGDAQEVAGFGSVGAAQRFEREVEADIARFIEATRTIGDSTDNGNESIPG